MLKTILYLLNILVLIGSATMYSVLSLNHKHFCRLHILTTVYHCASILGIMGKSHRFPCNSL